MTMRLIPLGRSIRRRLKDLLYEPKKMEKFPEIYIVVRVECEAVAAAAVEGDTGFPDFAGVTVGAVCDAAVSVAAGAADDAGVS